MRATIRLRDMVCDCTATRGLRPAAAVPLLLLAALALLASRWPARAQSATATLTGIVTDSLDAAVPKAEIRIRNVDTGIERVFTSGESGDYTITNLPPGAYELRAEKPGFRPFHETGIVLQLDAVQRCDVRLQLGAVSESVEVKADPPLLNTENASKGDVIVQEEIAAMPLDGRDFVDLAYFVAGVLPRAPGGQGSALNINGARADNTNFVIDGFNNQNPRGAAAQARANVDAVQEFKTQVSGYSAEYGRLAGGVINTVLRSGTNRLHGALFEFLRNDALDTRNFFDADKGELRRNQFGGVVHGPVYVPRLYDGRNRTFFLFSWESYRQRLGETRLGRTPTPIERGGDFSQTIDSGRPVSLQDPLLRGACTAADQSACFPDNRVPLSRFHPVAVNLLPYYPLPNIPAGANNFRSTAIDPDNWEDFAYKIDHHFSSSDSISGRYLKRYNRTANPFSGSNLGTFGARTQEHQSLAGVNWTHIFTPALLNEARAGFSRTAHRERSVSAGQNIAAQIGLPGTTTDPQLLGFPRFTVRDLFAIGDAASEPVIFHVNNFQWADTVTWISGKHAWKFGLDVLHTQFFQPHNNNNRGTFNFLGRWTGAPFADFLLGLPESASRQVGTTPNYLFSTSYGFFVQDDFRVSRNVTLNLGLRYDIIKPPVEKYNRMANFVPGLGKIAIAGDENIPNLVQLLDQSRLADRVVLARDAGLPRSLIFTNYANLAPRFGFAWRPRGGNRAVVRGGYGIFYGVSLLNPIRQDLLDVFPFAVTQTFNRQTTNPNAVTLSDPFPESRATLDGVNNANGYEVRAPTPYLQSYNLTVEREIGGASAIEIGYVGSKGTHLGRRFDVNQPLRIPELRQNGNFPRPYAGFNTIDYYSFGSSSIYNAGVVSLRRRTRGDIFYRLNYIYSKSIDDASQITGNSDGGYPGAQNARNLRLDRGRSDWDTGHAVTGIVSWQLPLARRRRFLGGWQLSGTTRLYTGQPFTVRVSNVNLNLGEANRPDRIGKGALPNPTADRWFQVGDFPVVPTGSFRFGNSGRNILDAPGLIAINSALLKNFRLQESRYIQFRYEVFNVFNHPNFDVPQNLVNAVNAGTITAADPGRVMQFALKIEF